MLLAAVQHERDLLRLAVVGDRVRARLARRRPHRAAARRPCPRAASRASRDHRVELARGGAKAPAVVRADELERRTSTRSTSPELAAACRRRAVTVQPAGASKRNPVPCTVWVDGSARPRRPAACEDDERQQDRDGRPGGFGTPAQAERNERMNSRDKVYGAADNIKPYVERAMTDEKLRGDVLQGVRDCERALQRADGRPRRAGHARDARRDRRRRPRQAPRRRSRISAARATG